MGNTKFNPNQLPDTLAQTKVVDISSADFLSLLAVNKPLIAAPGDGFIICPTWCTMFFYGEGETPYNVDAAGQMGLFYDGVAFGGGAYAALPPNILVTAADQTGFFTINDIHGYDLNSVLNNKPLTLGQAGAGEYILGTGTAKIVVDYRVIPIL